MRAMAEVSGRPMSITTLQRPEQHPDEYRELLALIDDAVADGVELRGQVAARPVGIVLTLGGRAQSASRVDDVSAARCRGAGRRTRRSACAIPKLRATILRELAATGGGLSPSLPALVRAR